MAEAINPAAAHPISDTLNSDSDSELQPTPTAEGQKFGQTPITRKLSGNPSTKKSLKHLHMDPALKEELAESELLDVPGLVEYLFPDSMFGTIPIAKLHEIVRRKHWSKDLKDWNGFSAMANATSSSGRLKPGSDETAAASFLNNVGQTIKDAVCEEDKSLKSKISTRKWASKSQHPLQGGPDAKRKPDACLVNNGRNRVTWDTTLVVLEIKPNESEATSAFLQLTNSAYMIFSTQDERRFFIGVSICAADVRVYVFDRSGVIGSSKFDFTKDTELLVRLMSGLILTDASGIGLDSSIRHKGKSRYVTVAGVEYEIIKTLFVSDAIRGRGTTCWKAKHADEFYVIKDTWTDVSRLQTEAQILKAAAGIPDVVQLVAEEVVHVHGKKDTTSTIRSIIADLDGYYRQSWYENVEVRDHRRLVTTPVAEPLTNFRSKRELLQALIGAIKAHGALVKKHILHRDISINNVMIRRVPRTAKQVPPSSEEGSVEAAKSSAPEASGPLDLPNGKEDLPEVRGILIDLDYAMITEDENGEKFKRTSEPTGHRTGTLPFMAIEILLGLKPGEEHQPHHDLESFFYILLWIAVHYAGPCDAERQDIDVDKMRPIEGWLESTRIQDLGDSKEASMYAPDFNFTRAVGKLFTLYFQDLFPCINELRHKLFNPLNPGSNEVVTHQDMIDILQKHMETLPEVEKWSSKDDKKGYGTGKRKFETIREEPEDSWHNVAGRDEEPSPTLRKRARTSTTVRDNTQTSPTVAPRRSTRTSVALKHYKY